MAIATSTRTVSEILDRALQGVCAAWKSIEWGIAPPFVKVNRTTSPSVTRSVGAGT